MALKSLYKILWFISQMPLKAHVLKAWLISYGAIGRWWNL
jgi:hypothetical protein